MAPDFNQFFNHPWSYPHRQASPNFVKLLLRLVSIVLTISLLFQTVQRIVLYADYEINKDFITQKYCENKLKPEIKCHGKCHLKKQLQKADKNEVPDKKAGGQSLELSLFVPQSTQVLRSPTKNTSTNSFAYLLTKTDERALSFFHPPTFEI